GAGSREPQPDLTARVPWRRPDRQFITDRVLAVDQNRLSGLDHWQDAVAIREAALNISLRWARIADLVLGSREKVFGIGKGRHPESAYQHRIPADVIGMQVGAQNDIDFLRPHAGCAQAVQEGDIKLMEAGKARSVLVIACTAVQQNGVAPGADQPGLDAADQPVVARRVMMWHQPVEMARQHLPLETIEIVFRRSAGEANLLLDPDYRHVSDRP